MAVKSTQPTLAEILDALNTAGGKASDDKGVTRVVITGACGMIGAIILALVFWVGTSVNSLSSTIIRMSANVDQLQKSLADLQTSQSMTSTQLSDGKATDARQDARMDAEEADINRIKERVRMLEGQKPVNVSGLK